MSLLCTENQSVLVSKELNQLVNPHRSMFMIAKSHKL